MQERVLVCLCSPSLTYFVALCEEMLDQSQSPEPFTSRSEVQRRQLFIKQTLQDEGPYTQGLEVW